MEVVSGEVVGLPPNLKRQFYPPLLFLDYLVETQEYERRSSFYSDPPLDWICSSKQIFHDFVSKIAFLCQTDIGGDAVSACMILQLPEKARYVFATNGREEEQLLGIQHGIELILGMLRDLPPRGSREQAAVEARILRAGLSLCASRLNSYLNRLSKELTKCRTECIKDNAADCE